MMNYKQEDRWALRYVSSIDGKEKVCYPRSEAKKNEQLALCKSKGVKVISCKKLYPFNTERNQHNFELICNICANTIYDMCNGVIPYNDAEVDRLSNMRQKAESFFCLPLPVAWLPYEDWRAAKELANMAILHRQNACIENGRPDLVSLC